MASFFKNQIKKYFKPILGLRFDIRGLKYKFGHGEKITHFNKSFINVEFP